MAAAAVALPTPGSVRPLARIALALAASLLAVFLRVGRAVAADRTMRAASASSAATFAISGNTIKWGVVTVVLGCAYVFRREETPLLTETVMPDDEPPAATATASAGLPTAVDDGAAPTDDNSLNAALFARMQQLATETEATDADADSSDASPPADSTDGWGEGNTAVLEPPKPGEDRDEPPSSLFDGEPPVEFPTGFPLVDTEPAASDDQIAMLQRMFGSASGEE